jgi:Na+/melibiose symporter-like transporter
LDVTGALLITGGLSAFIYAVVNTTTEGWGASSTLEWLAVASVGIVGFVFWEAKVATQPLVPFRVFHSRPLTIANLVMLLAGGAFFSMWFFLTYYFQEILGYGAVRAGFSFLPMAVAIIIGSQVSSRLLVKVGVRPIILVGSALATLGFFWLSLITIHSTYWVNLLPASFVASFAMGLLFAPLATAATAKVDRADAGLASGVLNSSRQIGGSLSLAVLGTIAADRTASVMVANSHLQGVLVTKAQQITALHVAYVDGYIRAFQVAGGITTLAFVVSLLMPAGVGHHSSHAAPAPESAGVAGH